MPKVFFNQPDGAVDAVDGGVGDSVMHTAVRHGVRGIVGQCGGSLSCATCHVYLSDDQLDLFAAVSETEDEMLECTASDREANSRLSCQLLLSASLDIHVTVPEEQL